MLLENKNDEIQNSLALNGIKNIFYGNEIPIEELEEAINKNKTTEEILTEEINNLKEIILKEKINNNKIKKENNGKIQGKIISIIGGSGVGKSIFTANLSLAFEDKKILIIDFDILNKSIKTIFGVKEKVAEEKETWTENYLNNLTINISNNIDLISGIDVIFDDGEKQKKEEVINILQNLRNRYEIIIFDTSSECFMDYTKEVIKTCDFSVFLVEANLIELKKAKRLLEIYK